MNGYFKPELVDVSEFVATVHLASGPNGLDVDMWWTHHDSGTLSTLKLIINFPQCNGGVVNIFLNDPARCFNSVLSCSRGHAEIKDGGKRLKVVLTESLNGGTNINMEVTFTPGPFKNVESGSYKIPAQYDEHLYTPREGYPKMPYQDEVVGTELTAYCQYV